MMNLDRPTGSMSRGGLRLLSVALALAVFMVDALTPLEGAVAVLYVVAILLAARTNRRNDIIVAAAGCIVLTTSAYLTSHGLRTLGSPALRGLVSLAAIGITTLLVLQNYATMGRLTAQARLLNLSHDMIFARDHGGVILFWNKTAEQTYGWSAEEAQGQPADKLLRTSYSERREVIEASLIETGRWEGRVAQRTKAGIILTVDARWALQHDHLGKPIGVLETHTDVTDRVAGHNALLRSEQRYRRMFDASRIGVVEEDWSELRSALDSLPAQGTDVREYLVRHPEFVRHAHGLVRIIDVNPALQKMAGADNAAVFVENVDKLFVKNDQSFLDALAAFAQGRRFHEGETELVRLDGYKIPVLFTITFSPRTDKDLSVLIFVVDITERKQAHDALLAAQAELAHAARVATLGELSASIAHEVNQPLTAIITSAEAGLRWLRRDVADLDEVGTAISQVIAQGRRAGEIVTRIRTFLKKAPPQRHLLQIGEIISEATALVARELATDDVALIVESEHDLPPVRGDRIQLQQVLINLLVNACQAMAGHPGSRTIKLRAGTVDDRTIAITVQDSGPGIQPDDRPRLFDPFFTTKDGGMGMGLAICRTTVEAHGGRLSVASIPGSGATFQLTLPYSKEHDLR
ncbi:MULTISPECIES: ATP-binding protein [Bradyrhizobium]|jgi:PAS domain S-box-containing protein|uniref:sensor histidine kinase n=1 Tax=Bradyrhizobium TaxID=374 RepID=UPI0020234CCE|nr:ATP-binding protein [Bradyrhizobium denitrificans]MCL8486267.1 PAS domain S-box protein [Bradyrhizobium denitrificans]